METATKPIYPLPEAIKRGEGGWTKVPAKPVPGDPATSVGQQRMAVPTGDSPLEDAIRAHEMGHAAWSPAKVDVEDVTMESITVAEEARVNYLIQTAAGINLDDLACRTDATIIREQILNNDWKGLVHTGVASLNSGRFATWQRAVKKSSVVHLARLLPIVNHCQAILERSNASDFETTVEMARYLDTVTKSAKDKSSSGKGRKLAACLNRTIPDAVPTKDDDKDDGSDQPIPFGFAGIGKADSERVTTTWGTIHMVTPPLSRSLAGRFARKRIAMEEGAIPRAIHRLPVDGRVFDYRVRKPGGSVLIDCSGSMQLENDDIDAIIKAAPAATIATYCGQGANGELRIVAKNGMVAASHHLTNPSWGGNVVDGPALKWLAKQEEPRLWVCDGWVSGVCDHAAPNLDKEARRIARRARIDRVHHVGQVSERLAEIRKAQKAAS